MAPVNPVELELDIHANVGLVRPGDKLVIAIHRPVSDAEVAAWQEYITAQLLGVEAVVVCADALAVYRPDRTGEVVR